MLIKVTDGSAYKVEKKEFKGHEYMDIRLMYRKKDSKEWEYTRKGISINIDNGDLRLLKQIVKAIKVELDK